MLPHAALFCGRGNQLLMLRRFYFTLERGPGPYRFHENHSVTMCSCCALETNDMVDCIRAIREWLCDVSCLLPMAIN